MILGDRVELAISKWRVANFTLQNTSIKPIVLV